MNAFVQPASFSHRSKLLAFAILAATAITITLNVPDGTTVQDIHVTTTGPASATVTAAPSSTAVTAPGSATASTPKSSTN